MALSDNRILYYQFTGGSLNDSGPNGYTLTAFNGPIATTEGHNGSPNNALLLDGVNQYLTATPTAVQNLSADFSFSCFLKMSTTDGGETFIRIPATGGAVHKIYLGKALSPVKDLQFSMSTDVANDVIYQVLSRTAFVVDNWYNVTVVKSGTNLKIYLDDVEVINTTVGATLDAGTSPTLFGAYDTAAQLPWDGSVDEVQFWDRAITRAEVTEIWDSRIQDEITIDEIGGQDYILPFGDSDTATVNLSGTYGLALVSPEVRVFIDGSGTTVLVNGNEWNTLTSEIVGGGVWSGTLSGIPKGTNWLRFEVRKSNSTSITGETTNTFGVGYIALVSGQSQAEKLFTVGTGTPNASLRMLRDDTNGWVTCTGAGAIAMGNQMVVDHGCVVGLINAAVGGSALHSKNDIGFDWFLEGNGSTSPAPNYTFLKSLVSYAGGSVHSVVWALGGTEASGDMSTFKSDLEYFFANQLRVDVLNAKTGQLKILTWLQVRNIILTTTDEKFSLVSQTYLELFDEGVTQGIVTPIDQELATGLDFGHLTDVGYQAMGLRNARWVGFIEGVYSTYRGPRAVSATVVDSENIDVSISLDYGTDITPSTGIDSFEVNIGTVGSPNWVASTGARLTANSIRLTHATGDVTGVRALYGRLPGTPSANILKDNSALTQPVFQETDIELKIIVSPNTGQINIEGFNPVVTAPKVYDFNVGQINIEGFNPVIDASVRISPNTGQINIEGFNPVISTPVFIVPNVGTINIQGYNPIIEYEGIRRPPASRIFIVPIS